MTAAAFLLTLFAALLTCANVALAQQSSPPSTLSVPQLTAQRADGAIELRWPAVPGALRYELWSWTSAGGWVQLGGDDLTATSYTHAATSTSTTYYYQVRALGAFGDASEWSQLVVVTVPGNLTAPTLSAQAQPKPTPLPNAPPPPVGAPPPQNAYGSVELSWDAVTGAARYELWTWWDQTPRLAKPRRRRPDRNQLHPLRPFTKHDLLLPGSCRQRLWRNKPMVAADIRHLARSANTDLNDNPNGNPNFAEHDSCNHPDAYLDAGFDTYTYINTYTDFNT